MFAFRRALHLSLHQKIILLSPQPGTLADLVSKARELDDNWRTFAAPLGSSRRPSGPRRNSNARVCEVVTEETEVNATQGRATPRRKGKLTPAERKHRMDNNLCLYCGKEGHKAIECTAPPNKRPGNSRPGSKLRQVETVPEEDENPGAVCDDRSINQVAKEEPIPFDTEDTMKGVINTSF